jgi:phosphatidylglycerophosphate synthase
MIVAKQVADLITLTRALLLFVFAWLGLTQGAGALPLAALLLVYSWTSDLLDGSIARRSRVYYHSWLGDHDLEVDMAVSIGVLIYLLASGFVSLPLGIMYVLVWLLIFWRWGLQRSPGMLFQAPIYAALIWVSLRDAFYYGVVQVFWVLGALVITWPRFPKEVVPGFLAGFGLLRRKKFGSKNHHQD